MTATWENLNRYVDGELDARAAALVAAEIARDPDLAGRVATLHRLKSVASTITVDVLDTPTPDFIQSEPTRLPYRWQFGAIAASLAVLLATAITTTIMQYAGAPSVAPEISQAFAAHQAWLAQPAVATPNVNVARAPDLSAAGLKLVFWQQAVVSPARENVMFGYLGPHGCKLGLWIGAAWPGLKAEPESQPSFDGIDRYAWSDKNKGYVVSAHGMDSGRLRALASVIASLVRHGQPPDDEDKIALSLTANDAKPCHG